MMPVQHPTLPTIHGVHVETGIKTSQENASVEIRQNAYIVIRHFTYTSTGRPVRAMLAMFLMLQAPALPAPL